MAEWLRQRRLRDMKCIVNDLEVTVSNPGAGELGRVHVILLPKAYLNKKYP